MSKRIPKHVGAVALLPVFALALALATAAWSAPLPSVPVTSCGQVVPRKTNGYLTADLDCTGYTGGLFGLAVELDKGSTLDLAGFTLTGGKHGVGCVTPCPRGGGICSSSCKIRNGTVQGADATGILADKVTLENVIVRDHGDRGIDGNRVTILGSTVTGNVIGVVGVRVLVRSSTISDNGRGGVVTTARGRARVYDSTLVDNDTSEVCLPPTVIPCVDIDSARRPDVRRTVCQRSYRADARVGNGCGNSWCVCSEDGM